MTCEELDQRSVDYLYGELPEAERLAVEAHLASCEGCRRTVGGPPGSRRRRNDNAQGLHRVAFGS